MATRCYITTRVPGTKLLGPWVGDWYAGDSTRDTRGQHGFIFRLAQTATNGGVSIFSPLNSFSSNEPTTAQNIVTYRWVTDPLGADTTVDGTITFTARVSLPSTSLSQTAHGQMYAYVSQGDTLTERAVLVNNVTDATAWTTSTVWRTMTFACTSAAALAGDRIVVEFGAQCSPGTDVSNIFAVEYGTTNASQVVLADATNGSGAAAAAWCEFSTDLTFAAAPAPNSNDACADALPIASVPYVSEAIDTTESTDLDHAAWWIWTADRSGRMFATTWGGNYTTAVRVFTGDCAGLVFEVGSASNAYAWQGTAQAVSTWEAVQGTTYYIRVTSFYATSGPNVYIAAAESGGSLTLHVFPYVAPAYGDLFVDCQHIVCFREGVPINVTPNFYGNTPTGNCIDYTQRTLDDLNGGTNASKRLYVGLFGSSPLVEILDLETLNVTGSEIDFILDPLNPSPHSQNIASLAIDVNGNLVTGYFGDGYSVLGSLSSPASCAITRLNATHADDQTGAPWPDATRFTVEQQNEGSDYLDLTLDGSTAYYTSAGTRVLRFNLDTNTQLADFGAIPAQTNIRPGARNLKLFPPQDGSTGLIVAAGNVVYRLNSSGVVSQTYTPSLTDVAQDLDKVDFTPDSSAFWVSDQFSAYLFKFDVLTGAQLLAVDTGLPPGQLSGFSVYGSRKQSSTNVFSIATRTDPIRRLRQAPHLWDGALGHRLQYPGFQLLVESGAPRDVDAPLTFALQWSDDGGHSWSNLHSIAGSLLGQHGYRFWWRRLGQSRDRIFRIVNSDQAKVVVVDALLVPDPVQGAN